MVKKAEEKASKMAERIPLGVDPLGELKVYVFEVTGLPPGLLQHSWKGMKQGKSPTGTANVPAEQQAAAGVYVNEDGVLYAPSAYFRASLLAGCVNKKFGRVSLKTIIQPAVFAIEEECPLYHPKTGKPITDYEIFTTKVTVPSTGAGVLCSRPLIREWQCKVAFEVDRNQVHVDDVLMLFQRAGRVAGVGAWRPKCPKGSGPYGKYTVKLVS